MSETCNPDLDLLVAARLAELRERITAAGGREVTVLPVTKTFPVEACWAAYRAGCTAVGENYAQEVVAKFDGTPPPFGIHFIGQLQTNKVRMLAPLVSVYETVDRPSLVRELAKRVPGAQVLVQVDTTGEPGKGGCPIDDAAQLVDGALEAGLRVRGLMTVGPTEGGAEAARPGFRAVRALLDRLGLEVCSMGMTADLEVAVQEGATQVRVGSALFGRRPPATASVR
ncbi:MAG: YggS family pyridoxal phosphate enzyme [Acidimicrobiaceae bacterium]|nr:YggS family pyridoxal phosphate enzyme [Ilumatobacter sp.]MCB9381179.1 YggS family pyridoxal phosphate enzyme [Acidimicrobiaceae bacterium]MCO5331092.1 YggS family pyridoxal phosphate enzyme [Ilumatobacteraceae bacterium]